MLALAAALSVLAAAVPGGAAVTGSTAAAAGSGHVSWRAADGGFAGWTRRGVELAGGSLRLEAGRSAGEAVSPPTRARAAFAEAIPSWNAATPAGSWLEVELRARTGGRWTRWWRLGVWSATNAARRHSVAGQADGDGRVETDTLVLRRAADAVQLRLRLRASGAARPTVRLAAVATSAAPLAPRPGDRSRWRTLLDVPRYSQMVYPDGGEVWCSPTSLAMVLAYWRGYRGPAEPRVRRTVTGVHDRVYGGHGNWPFNTAFAATEGLQATVARLRDLREAERWVQAGVPVILSFGWRRGELPGASGSSAGHLAVLVGFDASGDPVVNDPAARSDAAVRRTYPRARLEELWLRHSRGTVYLVHPPGRRVPAL